jgi:YD repeat-containing protein
MRRAALGFALWLLGICSLHAAPAPEDYALVTAHVDSAIVRERSAAGRVLVFVDVLGRKNRCVYGDDGNVTEIHYASSEGEFTTRFIYTKLGQLTTIVLADHTAVVFRAGKMQPSGAKPTLAESYAAALEHWLKQKNLGR